MKVRMCGDTKKRGVGWNTVSAARTLLFGRALFIEINFNRGLCDTVYELQESMGFEAVHCNHIDTIQCLPANYDDYMVETHNVMFVLCVVHATSATSPSALSLHSSRALSGATS